MWTLLALLGCPGSDSSGTDSVEDTSPEGCFSHNATVEIGETLYDADGRPTWTPMEEGSQQIMVHGPQGGWHVLAAAWVEHSDPIVELIYTVFAVDYDTEVSYGDFRVMLVTAEECAGYYPAMYGILDVSSLANGEADTPPEILAGTTLRLHMTMIDQSGRTAEDERTIIAKLDPQDEPDADTGD
jgi:hypothetical protein